jgi:hypothetical protein
MRVKYLLVAAAALAILSAAASADVVSFTLGDNDGLGFGLVPGGIFNIPFDRRTPTDPTFTDFGVVGETNAWFTFAYAAITGTANSAWMEFGLGGMEDARNDSGQPDFNDRLFLDAVEVPGAFDTAYTGQKKYGIVYQTIPVTMLSLLVDGTAAFFFDGHPLGTWPTPRAGDQVSFDYVVLSIDYTPPVEPVPAPSAAALLAVGAAVALASRRLWPAGKS